jgi:hypothetical protein
MTYFCLARTDGFDILLIKHDVGRPDRKIKGALLRCRHSVENAQKQPPLLPPMGWFLRGRKILFLCRPQDTALIHEEVLKPRLS